MTRTTLAILGGVMAAIAIIAGLTAARSSEPQSQTFAVPAFTAVNASGAFNTDISIGARQSVTATGDPDLIKRLEVRVVRGSLVLGTRSGMSWGKGDLTVRVTVPALDAVSLAGSGDLSARGITAQQFAASLTGSGDVVVAGTCTNASLSLQGSGDLDAGALVCSAVAASVQGSGDLIGHATRSVAGSVQGSGDMLIKGKPAQRAVTTRGSGALRYE
jgi:hypothetical protein